MKKLSGSLFGKIFFWFWLLLTLVSVVNLLVFFLKDAGQAREHFLRRDTTALRVFGSAALDLKAGGDSDAIGELAKGFLGDSRLELFLMDSSGTSLLGGPLPSVAAEPAAKTLMDGSPKVFEAEKGLWIVTRVIGLRSGEPGVIAQKTPKRSALPPPFRPHIFWQRFAIALGLSGLLAWLLARSLSLPISRLKMSTRRLADGDLEVRAPASVAIRGDEIGDLAKEFDLMAARTQELVTSRDRMLRDISHELRSPLARLGVALELAGRKAAPETDAALGRIRQEAERLNELIGQLLTLSSMEGGAQRPGLEPVDLAEVVLETIRDADFEARQANRSVDAARIDQAMLSGHREMIRRAVENVVRNAVRHTAEGTSVEVSLEKMGGRDGGSALIRVRDHGPGVPAEFLEEIFTPFFRVGEAREREMGGVGIGLAITRRVVQTHGGTVSAFNAPDGGLVVEMSLPA